MKTFFGSLATCLLIAVATPGGCATAADQPRPVVVKNVVKHGNWMKDLKMSNEQQGKLKDLREAAEKNIEEKRDKIQENEAKIPGLIASDKITEAKAMMKENSDLEYQISEIILDTRTKLYASLTDEQRTKLTEAIKKRTAQDEAAKTEDNDEDNNLRAERRAERSAMSFNFNKFGGAGFFGNTSEFSVLPPEERQLLGVGDWFSMNFGNNNGAVAWMNDDDNDGPASIVIPPIPPRVPRAPHSFNFKWNNDDDEEIEVEGNNEEFNAKMKELELKLEKLEKELKRKSQPK